MAALEDLKVSQLCKRGVRRADNRLGMLVQGGSKI